MNPGDLLVEFDRQNQLKAAIDKRSEFRDFEEQIRRNAPSTSRFERRMSRAFGYRQCGQQRRARDEENAYLGRIDIEKNELRLEEAQAKQKQLKATFDLSEAPSRPSCAFWRFSAIGLSGR